MEKRKNAAKDLRGKSTLFFQIGLLIAMSATVSAFEFRSDSDIEPIVIRAIETADDELITITDIQPPPPPSPKKIFAKPDLSENDGPIEEPPELDFTFEPIDKIPEPEPFVKEPEPVEEEPFLVVEKMPEPKGGMDSFFRFVSKNLKYPRVAKNIGVEGTVYLEFIVDENGDMTNLKIIKGIGAGCDKEVMRIFQNPPKWEPGKQRGRPVKVRKVMPIKFKLN